MYATITWHKFVPWSVQPFSDLCRGMKGETEFGFPEDEKDFCQTYSKSMRVSFGFVSTQYSAQVHLLMSFHGGC